MEPIPTSRQPGSSMFSRWAGEPSQAWIAVSASSCRGVVDQVLAGRPGRVAGGAVEALDARDERRAVR